MNERRRRAGRPRHPLATVPGVVLLMSIGGCFSFDTGSCGAGVGAAWGSVPGYSCDLGPLLSEGLAGALGDIGLVLALGGKDRLGFQSVCSVDDLGDDAGADGGVTPLDAGTVQVAVHEGSELGCVFSGFYSTVAVGAPFGVQYIRPSGSDAGDDAGPSTSVLPVVPAVPSAAQQTSSGWVVPPDHYVTFFAMDGTQVADHVDVVAHDVASVRLATFAVGCPTDLLPLGDGSADAADAGCSVLTGTVTTAVAMMQDDAGLALGGPTQCTFASSAPAVAQMTGRGIVAHVTALTPGDASLTVSCMGQQANLLLHVSAAPSEGGSEDATLAPEGAADAGAEDASNAAPDEAGDAAAGNEGGDGP